MPVISFQNLKKSYALGENTVHALRGVSLDIEAGEFVTDHRAFGRGQVDDDAHPRRLDRPTEGRYLLNGKDVSNLSRDELAEVRSKQIGFVFQDSICCRARLPPRTSKCRCSTDGRVRPSAQRRAASIAALEVMGLGERTDHLPNQLSGGQQQRVAIARALVS